MSAKRLFHITGEREWRTTEAAGRYLPGTYYADGFIHCSYAHQVVRVANTRFRDRRDLVLLEIERERMSAEIVDENLEGGSELFPHIYGPLPTAAVVAVHAFPCGKDGSFELPEGVTG